MARTDKAVAARLERLQEVRGIKHRQELARLAGVSSGTMSDILSANGKHGLSLDAAFRLKDKTGATLDWLYDGDPEGLPPNLAKALGA